MKLQPWARAAFWLATVAVLVLTLSPGPLLPRDPFNLWDKAQHALAFAVLTGVAVLGWPQPALRWRLLISLVTLGGAIEVVEHLSGWRHGEWADWAADAVGVVLVGLVAQV
jgi:hypothetical protein